MHLARARAVVVAEAQSRSTATAPPRGSQGVRVSLAHRLQRTVLEFPALKSESDQDRKAGGMQQRQRLRDK